MQPPSVYIAARYGRIRDARDAATTIASHGVTVTASWLQGPNNEPCLPSKVTTAAAQTDLRDIQAASHFLFLSEDPDSPFSRGGRHVELGYALALDKPCIGIGPKENLFHHLPQVTFASTAEQAARLILQDPFPHSPLLPLLQWPTVATLYAAALRNIEEMTSLDQYVEELDLSPDQWDDDPPLSTEEVRLQAPTLFQAMSNIVQNYDIPNIMLNFLDREIEDLARQAARETPALERANLHRAAQEARARQQNR